MLDSQKNMQYINKKCKSDIKVTSQHIRIATTAALDYYFSWINITNHDKDTVSKNLSSATVLYSKTGISCYL